MGRGAFGKIERKEGDIMAWQTPKTNWNVETPPLPADFNRIEGNIAELRKAATIEIADVGGYFVSTNVESALAELFQLCK